MKKQDSDTEHGKIQQTQEFSSVVKYLKVKDLKWFKRDMGLYDLPEEWDMEFKNDNDNSAQRPFS